MVASGAAGPPVALSLTLCAAVVVAAMVQGWRGAPLQHTGHGRPGSRWSRGRPQGSASPPSRSRVGLACRLPGGQFRDFYDNIPLIGGHLPDDRGGHPRPCRAVASLLLRGEREPGQDRAAVGVASIVGDHRGRPWAVVGP